MAKFGMSDHVRVRAHGLDFYGMVVAFGTYGKYWRYSVESFDGLYYLHRLRESEMKFIEGDGMPKVYNKTDYNVPEDAVYVGRPSEWGNPFIIGKDGTREEVIAKFEKIYVPAILKKNPDWLEPLRGKDLVCWCAPEACHADVLLRLANAEPEEVRPFAIRSNMVNQNGFRVVLCVGNQHEDGTVTLTQTFNKVINQRTGKRDRVDLCKQYNSMDALLKALETQDVRCIVWQDTQEYTFINRK